MDLQEKYDELDNIIRSLDILMDEITDEDYISQLEETKFQAQRELDEIEPILQEQRDKEERMQNEEYMRSVL